MKRYLFNCKQYEKVMELQKHSINFALANHSGVDSEI